MGGCAIAEPWVPGVLAEWSHAADRGVVKLADGRRLPVGGLAFGGMTTTPYAGLACLVLVAADGRRVAMLREAYAPSGPAAA